MRTTLSYICLGAASYSYLNDCKVCIQIEFQRSSIRIGSGSCNQTERYSCVAASDSPTSQHSRINKSASEFRKTSQHLYSLLPTGTSLDICHQSLGRFLKVFFYKVPGVMLFLFCSVWISMSSKTTLTTFSWRKITVPVSLFHFEYL